MSAVQAIRDAPWIAHTVAGSFPYRITDWQREYSHHATVEAARRAVPAAAEAQRAFRVEQQPDPVDRKVAEIILLPVYRSIMERHGLTRVPGSGSEDE